MSTLIGAVSPLASALGVGAPKAPAPKAEEAAQPPNENEEMETEEPADEVDDGVAMES